MSLTVGQTYRVTSLALSSSLAMAAPPSTLDVAQVRVTCANAFNVSDTASGVAFPVAAGDTIILPVDIDAMNNETGYGLYLSGTGTAYILWEGLPSGNNDTFV